MRTPGGEDQATVNILRIWRGRKCKCNCGYRRGERIGLGYRKMPGSGCRGAKAGNREAKHCRRKQNKCKA